ncbi:hypothetical protein [Raoultella ornithinolytica]|uniref:hypothetical protein n=1 Tax=Raoultella ornithinolytica TaxID=54291 RepID=UPI003AAB1DE0
MANMRLFGKHQGYVSNQVKLFNETISNGFITLPISPFFLLSTLKLMNQEGNFLSINDKSNVLCSLKADLITWLSVRSVSAADIKKEKSFASSSH